MLRRTCERCGRQLGVLEDCACGEGGPATGSREVIRRGKLATAPSTSKLPERSDVETVAGSLSVSSIPIPAAPSSSAKGVSGKSGSTFEPVAWKKAYQREYMRKWRARQKEKKANERV